MLKKDRDVLCHISGPCFCSEQFRRAAILNRFTIEDFHKYMDPNDGSRELIPIFHNPHRKGWPSSLTVARTQKYPVGVPSKATASGRPPIRQMIGKTYQLTQHSKKKNYNKVAIPRKKKDKE